MATSYLPRTTSDGSGSALNPFVLLCAGICTFVATVVTACSIYLQLKNYRKPILQRMVVRIMLMVPLYAISSLIALFSLGAAFLIDAIRDIYEAFVIYCFFHLLVAYLGGERSLLILLYGRAPKRHMFPVNIVKREFDGSDPFTFLMIRRGIFQYVYVKPILAAVTLILKAGGVYNEGNLQASSGYLWVSIVYNASICCSLYCLAMFWICINDDIKPFRPVPKFLCIKGILFFSFWQAIGVSILVNAGAIKSIGPYTDAEHISLAITDTLVCFEMPFFAIAHTFAFSHIDYIDPTMHYAARMPMYYAIRDAFGMVDVLEDSRATLKGRVSYKEYEPVEGGMHQGAGRVRRIRAGLRYAKGGRQKYWLPMPEEGPQPSIGTVSAVRNLVEERRVYNNGYTPFLNDEEGAYEPSPVGPAHFDDVDDELDELEFEGPDEEEDAMYAESKKFLFGDYNYPCIDVSSEAARKVMWDEEERILTDRRAAAFSPIRTDDGIAQTPSALLAAQRTRIAGYGTAGETPALGRGGAVDAKGNRRVYGVAGEDLDPYGKRPEESVRFDERGAIIDMAPDAQTPELNVEGVTLSLTNKGRAVASGTRTGSKPKAAKSTDYLSPSNRPPSGSKTPSTTSLRSTASERRGRPDAVDLVVEDPKAAQQEMERERRKGEPAVRQTGQRKVFKAAYTIEGSDDDEKDVGFEHEIEPGAEDPRRGVVPEIDKTTVGIRQGTAGPSTEERFTGAIPPPPLATNRVNRALDLHMDPEDNPWA